MRMLGRRGGAATKAKAEPGYYETIGAAGGRASKGKPKTKRTPPAGMRGVGTDHIVVHPDILAIVDELEREP